MKSIWKFPIEVTDIQVVGAPVNTKFLTAQFQGKQLCLWGEVDTTDPVVPFYIAVYGTGNPKADGQYIATVQDPRGPLVWHVYEHTERP